VTVTVRVMGKWSEYPFWLTGGPMPPKGMGFLWRPGVDHGRWFEDLHGVRDGLDRGVGGGHVLVHQEPVEHVGLVVEEKLPSGVPAEGHMRFHSSGLARAEVTLSAPMWSGNGSRPGWWWPLHPPPPRWT
jgi:hypothetical protein